MKKRKFHLIRVEFFFYYVTYYKRKSLEQHFQHGLTYLLQFIDRCSLASVTSIAIPNIKENTKLISHLQDIQFLNAIGVGEMSINYTTFVPGYHKFITFGKSN